MTNQISAHGQSSPWMAGEAFMRCPASKNCSPPAWLRLPGFLPGGLLLILGLICFGRAGVDKSEEIGSWKAAIIYILLIIVLTAISMVRSQAGLDE